MVIDTIGLNLDILINSTEIFGFVLQKLAHEYEPAAFLYQTHRDLL